MLFVISMKYQYRLTLVLFVAALLAVFLLNKNTQDNGPIAAVTITELGRDANYPDEFISAWKASKPNDSSRSQIVKQATERRDRFIQLMKSHPAEAIERAISMADYVALPEELKSYFERPLSAVGDVDLLWETSEAVGKARTCLHRNTVSVDGSTLKAYPANSHMLPVLKNVPLSGIRLGNHAVILDTGVRTLARNEFEVAEAIFPMAEQGNETPLDPVTHRPASDDHRAAIGGKIWRFESEAVVAHVEKTLAAQIQEAQSARGVIPPPAFEWLAGDTGGDEPGGETEATPYQVDQINVLFIRVDFSDFQGAPVSKADLEAALSTVDGHLDVNSYGQAGITYTVSNSVYRMPDTGADYATDNGAGDGIDGDDRIHTDASALAAADYTLGNYDVIAVYFPSLSGVPGSVITYGGLASIGGSRHWINGVSSFGRVGVILHEFGHNFGMRHANYHHPEQQIGGSYSFGGSLEYGDIFDEMGRGSSPEAHFSHLAKNYMQWMPDSKVAEATSDGTFTIYRFDHGSALSNSILALKVPMAGNVNYWVGYRQLFTSSNYNLSSAAYVVGENMSSGRETNLIDMTPESEANEEADRRDAGLPVGGTFYDSSAGVRFNALEKGGAEPNQWIKVQVVFDPRIMLAETGISVDEQCGVAHVVVQRAFGSSGVVTVDYTTSAGTATAGTDYYTTSGTLTWADGDMADKTVIVPIRPDVVNEGSEQLTFTLSNIAGGKLDAGASVATISILDAGQRMTVFAPSFFNQTVRAIIPLDDGRVVIGGNIYDVSGFSSIKNIARMNADGSIDETFISGTGFNDDVRDIALQSDGKLLVAGEFTSYNGAACNRIVRLDANGAIDPSFVANIGTGADGMVRSVAIESSGSIVLGGDFDNFDGTAANGMVRLSSTGAPAAALNLPFSANASVYTVLIEPEGKIMAGGNFSLPFTGLGNHRDIVRLNINGSRDTSFEAGTGSNGGVNTVARRADGKYILGGYFGNYNGSSVLRCCRVNANGSLDTTFTPPTINSDVNVVLPQANGKTVMGGFFSSPANRLDRLTESGAADSSFDQGSGPGGSVYELVSDDRGSLWVGGNFYSYNGSSSRPVIRLAGGESPYEVWAQTRFTTAQINGVEAAPDQDPDDDGMTNLVEMAMGTNPTVANTEPVFGVASEGGVIIKSVSGQDYLQISLDKTTLAKGAWFVAQFGGDLSTWSPVSPTPAANASYEVIENSATRFTVRDKTPISSASPRFGRFVIKQPE